MEHPKNNQETESSFVDYEHIKSQVNKENLLAIINQRFPEDYKNVQRIDKQPMKLGVFPYKADTEPGDPDHRAPIVFGYYDYMVPIIGGTEPELMIFKLPETPETEEIRKLIEEELKGTGIRFMV